MEKNTADNSGSGRVVLYDWLRIIATIWVIIGHSVFLHASLAPGGDTDALVAGFSPVYNSGLLSFCRFLSGWVYIFHMPLFFALSGAVLALKPLGDFDTFVRRKAARLLIPYYTAGLLFMIPVKFLSGVYDASSLPEVIREFLSCNEDINSHLWFLPALFWLMILFAVFSKVLSRLKINSIYALLILAGLVSLCYQRVPFDLLFLKRGLDYMFYFTFGYVFETERRRRPALKTSVALIALAVLLVIELLYKKYLILNSFSGLVCGCALSLLLALLCDRFLAGFTKTRIWSVLMRDLFAVYLFHDPLEYATAAFFVKTALMGSGFGCVLYTFMRMLGVGILAILIMELLRFIVKTILSIIRSTTPSQEADH